MKNGKYWFGIVSGLIVAALIGFLLLPNLGVFPVAATGKANVLDWWGHTNLENFLDRKAPDSDIPATADTAEGFKDYLSMCLHCHGGPDAPRQEWAKFMLPKPPELWEEETQQEMTDGKFFYIVANGIRMTGMPAFGPTHSDEDIWNMVAFLRQLDQLTEQQKHKMQEVASKFHQGGDHGHDDDKGHHDDTNEDEHEQQAETH